jgi:hypothetical protein
MSDKIAEDADFSASTPICLPEIFSGVSIHISALFRRCGLFRPVLRMIKKITANALGKPVLIRGNFLSEKDNTALLIEAGSAGFISHGGDLLKIKEKIIEAE